MTEPGSGGFKTRPPDPQEIAVRDLLKKYFEQNCEKLL
jgi:hypothetical protein